MLRDSGRARYVAVTDERRAARLRELARLEGIVPALEPSHAIAWLLAEGERGAGTGSTCSTLSGRGDKDLAEALDGLRRLRPARWLSTGIERIAAAFAAAAGRGPGGADALPDGRLPGHGHVRGRRSTPTPTPAPT